jgi:hypothetical protein
MKDVKINILRSESLKVLRRVLGVIFIIISILWIADRMLFGANPNKDRDLHFFDYLYILFMLSMGIIYILDSYGISVISWFVKAYIKIDTERIYIKNGGFSKEWIIEWREVKNIEISVIQIIFTLSSNEKKVLSYNNLDYEHILKLKESVMIAGAEKNIPIL